MDFKPKTSSFLRETAVKRITLFKHFTILYVVYSDFFDFSGTIYKCTLENPTSLDEIAKEIQGDKTSLSKIAQCCKDNNNVSTCTLVNKS